MAESPKRSTIIVVASVLGIAAGTAIWSAYSYRVALAPFQPPTDSSNRWVGSEWTIDDIKGFDSNMSEADLLSIRDALNRETRHIIRPIVSIYRLQPNEITISTGISRGPLSGGGDLLVLRFENGNWRVVERTFWIG